MVEGGGEGATAGVEAEEGKGGVVGQPPDCSDVARQP